MPWDLGGYNQNIGAGDLDGDGVLDVISSYDAIGFGVFKGDGRVTSQRAETTVAARLVYEPVKDLAIAGSFA